MNCCAHLLNKALRNTFCENFTAAQVPSICETVQNVVCREVFEAKRTGQQSEQIRLQGVPTRWNSQLAMVKSVHYQLDDIERLLESRNSELANSTNKGTLQDLIALLQPFFDATSALEEEKRPTLHLVILHFARLHKDLDTHLRSPSMVVEKARLQERALHFLKEKVSLNVEHKIATLPLPSVSAPQNADR